MKPHELLKLLADQSGLSTLQLAREIYRDSFQGTLYRLIEGESKSPKHETAERIAKYFDIPIEALYKSNVATSVAIAKGLIPKPKHTILLPLLAQEQAGEDYAPSSKPKHMLPRVILDRISALDDEQFAAIKTMILSYLNTVAPLHMPQSKAS